MAAYPGGKRGGGNLLGLLSTPPLSLSLSVACGGADRATAAKINVLHNITISYDK
jgi:hypothetical protein